MNKQLLIAACQKLNWKYKLEKEILFVLDANQKANLRGEYVLQVTGNTVTYNTYYLKNGKQLIQDLLKEFYELNVVYAEQSILTAFEKAGFRLRRNWDFVPTEEVVKQFYMVTETRLAGEEEKETIIEFSILKDGTIVTDSNYLPQDVHELADKAMGDLDKAFGSTRREGHEIKRKAIPAKYKGKTYCTLSGQIKAKQDNTGSNKIILKN